jgi:serine/threonine protein kinase
MDFKQKYEKYSKEKFSCDKPPNEKPETIVMGYGGSENMVVLYKNYVFKIVPHRLYHTITTSEDELEILFYKLFTKRFLLPNVTPHIVGYYQSLTCNNISTYVKSYESDFFVKKCLTYDDSLMDLTAPAPNVAICKFNSMLKHKVIEKDFQLNVLEKCDESLEDFFKGWIHFMAEMDPKEIPQEFLNFLITFDDFIFQIIFTLAVIQDRYPWFSHRDLFAHNILLLFSKVKDDNIFDMYHYNGKKFYSFAFRHQTKLNDFGFSVIDSDDNDAIIPNKVDKNRNYFEYQGDYTIPVAKQKPDHKNDLLLLMTDLYGFRFMIKKYLQNVYPEGYDAFRSAVGRYIDVDTIDTIKKEFDGLGVSRSKILQAAIKTPREILMSDTFDYMSKPLPPGSKVRYHYNK